MSEVSVAWSKESPFAYSIYDVAIVVARIPSCPPAISVPMLPIEE